MAEHSISTVKIAVRAYTKVYRKTGGMSSLRPRRGRIRCVALAALALACLVCNASDATIVRFNTSAGSFNIRLFDAAMPRTVTNFLHYVTSNKFNGTAVHRNSDTSDVPNGPLRDFVIQGGGYTFMDPISPTGIISVDNVDTIPPIADEPGGGVRGPSNLRGTIAMAKSGPDTVTSQWFINQGNNSFLDNPARSDGGFSAFGMILGGGMSVVDAIGDLPIPPDFGFSIGDPFGDLPLRNFSGNALNQVRVQHLVTVTQVRVLNLPAGDYDFNGTVNAADYSVWKNTFGSTTNAAADGNGNGRVDAADYAIWRNSFGQTSAPGGGAIELGAIPVPEPAAALLAAFAAMSRGCIARRRTS